MFIHTHRILRSQLVMMRHANPMKRESLKRQMMMEQVIITVEVSKTTMSILPIVTGGL